MVTQTVTTQPAPAQSPAARAAAGLVAYDLAIQVLEDMHTGTGTGWGAVDAAQCLDRDGRPMLPLTVLHGQLRDTCARLESADWGAAQGIVAGTTVALFGRANPGADMSAALAPSKRRLHLGSAYFVNAVGLAQTLAWTSTARVLGDRRPKVETMRTVEYIAAGTTLRARCHLQASDKAVLQLLLQACSSLGANTTRGAGRVRFTLEKAIALCAKSANSSLPAAGPGRLAVVLQSMEPVAFTSDTASGNLMPTHDHIPGQALLGALLSECIGSPDSRDLAAGLLAGEVSFGPAYPLPQCWADTAELNALVSTACVRPALLSRQRPKRVDAVDAPGWTGLAAPGPAPSVVTDSLTATSDANRDGPAPKRLGDQHLEWRPSPAEPWQVYRRRIRGRQRIHKPGAGGKASEQNLFTVLEIPERTQFLAELTFTDAQSAAARAVAQRLTDGTPLWLGRGRRPVKVLALAWRQTAVPAAPAGCGPHQLRITLTSDLILRGPKLGFVQQWNLAALRWMMFSDAGLPWPDMGGVAEAASSEVVTVRGYNVMSRLPRMAQMALKRGSTLVLRAGEGKGCAAAKALLALALGLSQRAAWGERTAEGFGRLMCEWEPIGQAPTLADIVVIAGTAPAAANDEKLSAVAEGLARSVPDRDSLGDRVLQQVALMGLAGRDPLNCETWIGVSAHETLPKVFQDGLKSYAGDRNLTDRAMVLYLTCRWLMALKKNVKGATA